MPKPKKNPTMIITELTNENDARLVLELFAGSILQCGDLIRTGFYHLDNVFFHIIAESNFTKTTNAIFSDSYVKRHANIMAIETGRNFLTLSRYNFYEEKLMKKALTVGPFSQYLESLSDIFDPFDMNVSKHFHIKMTWYTKYFQLQGFTFRVGNMPYAYYTLADYDENATDPTKLFSNRSGSESFAAEAFCKVILNTKQSLKRCLRNILKKIVSRRGSTASLTIQTQPLKIGVKWETMKRQVFTTKLWKTELT